MIDDHQLQINIFTCWNKYHFSFETDLLFFLSSNRKFLDLYTVDLEGATPEELQTRELDLRTSAWLPLRELTQKDSRAQCLWDYESRSKVLKVIKVDSQWLKLMNSWKSFSHLTATAFRGYSIFQDLERVVLTDRNAGYSDASYRPYTGDLVDQLKEWMEEVDRNGTDVQKFAFSWEKAGDIFTGKQIVLFRGFKFLTGDSGQVQSDTKSRLFSEHFLPFFNKNHTDENCVSVKDLPKFYKNKGVDERQR